MRSTIGQLQDFLEGSIWKDIKDEIEVWIEDIRNELEDPNGKLFMEDIKKLQGNVEALRNVLKLPEILILNLKDELEERNGN